MSVELLKTYHLIKEENKIFKDQLLRSIAETENTRKRLNKDKQEISHYSIMNFARDIISIKDNLERAISNIAKIEEIEKKEVNNIESFLKGIIITNKEFSNILKKYNIKEINPLNKKFDSNIHQAMFEEEQENIEPNTITKVLQTGYLIKDKLLRPAMVSVSKRKNTNK